MAVALALAIALAAACGDGEGGQQEEDKGIDPELQALLEGMVLRREDLPPGLERAGVSFSTNEDVAQAASDQEAELARLEGWGRQLGIDVSFVPGTDAPPDLPVHGIQNSVTLYTAPDGASQSFRRAVEEARQADWLKRYPDLTEVEMEETNREVGDESVWFRVTGLDQSGNLVIDDQVAFRVGPVRSFLRVVSLFQVNTQRDAYLDEVASWARLVADRIGQAIADSAQNGE